MIESDEQKLVVVRVFRNGRRRYDPVSKARLVAACLEPGVSVSRLALDNGVNANLLWKWIGQHRVARRETAVIEPPSTPTFIPVEIEGSANAAVSMHDRMLDLRPDEPGARLPTPEEGGSLSPPARLNASLPNGVQLTLECGDANALSAMIGALCNVQTGR